MLMLLGGIPLATLADGARRLIEQPADVTFVTLQITLLAVQAVAMVMVVRIAMGK